MAQSGEPDDAPKPKPRWPWVAAGVVVLGFVAVVLAIVFVPSSTVWTDDAYVMVHYASVSPRLSGQIVAVAVDDNDSVRAGQLLVQLDDRDQRTSVARARAALARDAARYQDALANVARQPSFIAQQDSNVLAIEAQMTLARANQGRYARLARTGAGTQQSRQSADATLAEDQARLAGAHASADAARHQIEVLRATSEAAHATIAADQAQVRQAQLDLSYAQIRAPLDGVISERSVQVGDYVTPGSTLMTVVPLNRVYVVAQYREVALKHVQPGQHVRIHVDAYDIVLDGVVQGVPPASGAIYSPLAPSNATGNFTKIVRRLPVKILVAPNQNLARLLRAGLSVETTIDTHFADVVGRQANTATRVTAH
ncbi:HlyD family secretion protein [Lichenicoccus sp.]|uniref:HlyD family secretion protein n=1 Tax=Lichenicoccus sp. TaxID=2781899 RepID=UPI003D0C6D54